jgi:hypothetical protein
MYRGSVTSKETRPARSGFVVLFALLFLLPGCGRRAEGLLPIPVITMDSATERRESLDALRTAWSGRSIEISPAHERAERQFLNRLIAFVQRSRGKEVYADACRLWNHCYRDHASRYGDFGAPGQP